MALQAPHSPVSVKMEKRFAVIGRIQFCESTDKGKQGQNFDFRSFDILLLCIRSRNQIRDKSAPVFQLSHFQIWLDNFYDDYSDFVQNLTNHNQPYLEIDKVIKEAEKTSDIHETLPRRPELPFLFFKKNF